jgi:TRAP-type C4-dicarboxylate transport system substrate-binding protein
MTKRIGLRCAMAIAFATAAACCATLASGDANAEELRIATLAPRDSIWGKVFSVWAEAVAQKTNGQLVIRVDWNGTQGDEQAMIGKLKAGQLDGVTCSSLGLAQVHKPILALQMPGVFDSWEALDRGREALRPELEKAAEDAGFVISGWGDLGRLRGMGRGVAIRVPEDLRGRRALSFRTDTIGPTLLSMVEGATPVPLSAPEVLPALRTKSLDVLSAPALVAEQLQWAPLLSHVSSESSVFAIGGMVWSKRKLDALPPDLRQVLRDTGAKASSALGKRVRAEDDAAFARLSGKMTVIKLEPSEKKRWVDLFAKVRARLAQGTFSPDLVKRVEKLGGK